MGIEQSSQRKDKGKEEVEGREVHYYYEDKYKRGDLLMDLTLPTVRSIFYT